MSRIKIVGVGPGSISHLTPEAYDAIKSAEIVIGGSRHLENFAQDRQEKLVITNNLPDIIRLIKNRGNKQLAVLATGDPGIFSISKYILKHINPEEVEIIPGVSSIQLAFARLSMSWDDAHIVSAHGRSIQKIIQVLGNSPKAAVLTGPDNTPEKIYKLMGTSKTKNIHFCFDLSLPSEEILSLRSGEQYPETLKGRHNCVMVITND